MGHGLQAPQGEGRGRGILNRADPADAKPASIHEIGRPGPRPAATPCSLPSDGTSGRDLRCGPGSGRRPPAFEQAQEAFERADLATTARRGWSPSTTRPKLVSLALLAFLSLGDHHTAESPRSPLPAALRPHVLRSRAITTTLLSHAQLAQGDADAATATAMTISADAATQHPRVSRMLQEFGAGLRANSSTVQTWTQHTREAWRTPA